MNRANDPMKDWYASLLDREENNVSRRWVRATLQDQSFYEYTLSQGYATKETLDALRGKKWGNFAGYPKEENRE